MSIRLAWVGTAHIHTPGFTNEVLKRNVECAGVWDHDGERAKKNGEKLGGPVRDLHALIDDESVSGFVVCSETFHHLDLVRRIAPSGKPAFIEKPMGFDASQSKAIRDILEEHGVPFQTGYFSRGNGSVLALKSKVDEGFFGSVTRVRASNCHGGALGGWFDNEWRWMADRSQAGVGAFGDLGTHVLDLLMWMFGDVAAATGAMSPGTNRYPGCEELGESILKFKNGVIGTMGAAWDDVADPVRIQVAGTRGHATLGSDLMLAGPDGKFEKAEPLTARPAGFTGFLDYLGGAKVDLVTPCEAAARDVVMDAIYRGAESNSWITI